MRPIRHAITLSIFIAPAILLTGCTNQSGRVPISTFGSWPPHHSACVRNDQVDINFIGAELTRVHGDPLCVAQISVCTWSSPQSRSVDTDVTGAKLWEGAPTHLFSISEQNDIVARARAQAQALRPPGTTFKRLEFWKNVVVDSNGSATIAELAAIADYAVCTRIPGTVIPNGTPTLPWVRVPAHN